MTQAALGVKRQCLSCGGRFFDLRRDPIVCPKCSEVFTPPPPLPHRQQYRARTPEAIAAVETVAPEAVIDEERETEEEAEGVEDEAATTLEDDPDVLDPDLDPDEG
jgi:uncharacterized protein (TIGR02300 family)